MGVDGSNSGNFTEVSNMIANLEQNKQLFETMTSRATFARHHRKPQTNNNTEKLRQPSHHHNLYETSLETNLKETSNNNSNPSSSPSRSWTVEEIPPNPRQSKNLMETLNETLKEQDETNITILSESVKSDESITILNELYDEKSTTQLSETQNYSSPSNKRTPIQSSSSKKIKFDALIPNSIKNMFLSTKRSQPSNSFYEEETPKKTTKNRKSRQHESNSANSSPTVGESPNILDSVDNERIVSNLILIFQSETLQQFNQDSTSTSKNTQSNSTTASTATDSSTIINCIYMNGKEFIDLIRMSYQNLCKSNLESLDMKVLYSFVSTLISMGLMEESTRIDDENLSRLSLASNLCRNETLFERLNLVLYPERIKQEKEKVFNESLQFLSQHQVTCQPPCAQIFNSETNNSTSGRDIDDRNELELNTDKNMLVQRRESKLLLSFEEFLSVNNQYKMGSSLSQEDSPENSTIYKAEALDEEKPTNNSTPTINEMSSSNLSTDKQTEEENASQTTTTDLAISNSAANLSLLANLGTNVSNHIKQPSNTSNCNNTPSSSTTITPSSSNDEISSSNTNPTLNISTGPSPYELKLKIGEKSLSELKQQLKERKHRYGFLTPTQFLEFGLRAGFDEEEFASIFAVTYSTLMSAHQLIPQMQYVMKLILNDEKLPKPITDEEDDDENDPSRGLFLEDDCKLSKEEKNNVIGRVARFLKQFVLLSFSDFQYDKQFHEILYSFVAPLIGFIHFEASNGALVQEQVVNLVERITLVISGAHEDQFCQTEVAPKPLIKKLPTDPRKMNLIDIDPVEIARQLTLFEFSSFEKLSAKELLGASWMKDSKEWTAPNVTQLIWRSNQLTDWVSTFICSITNLKDRKKALKHLIHVADACLEIHNYNTVFEIVMGLISQPVYRLKKTWEVLKENDLQRVWKRLEDITSFPGNRRVYRDQIQKVIKESVVKMTPCLPYLGVHLSDLVFFDEGNKDSMEKGITTFYNCTKRSCMGQIVYQIIAVKKIPYNFQKVDLIEQFIWWQFNSKVLHDETERDKLSKKCE